jgi:penicillin-binding protein 2
LGALLCCAQLFNLQVISGSELLKKSEDRLVGAMPIRAARGEILDRNDEPLVSNRIGLFIKVRKTNITNEYLNHTINKLVNIMKESGETYIDNLPITESFPYRFNFDAQEDGDAKSLERAWKKNNNFSNNMTAMEIMKKLIEQFGISTGFSWSERRNIASVRFEMKQKQFGQMNPYVFARDVSIYSAQKIKEKNEDYPGVSIETEPIREYINGRLASHILGRTGLIYREEYEKMKDDGYGINDTVGKDGLEKILEPDIKGKDGTEELKLNRKNRRTSVVVSSKPPKPGNFAVLTIDKKLQEVAENSLEKRMREISSREGINITCGAAVAVQIKTGEVLAMATCPTYSQETFNKDYESLIKDPQRPMLNRALNGMYPPASTFKPLTALAGLEENVITIKETIPCGGYYNYTATYKPRCWKRGGHGRLSVVNAIASSCNCFFYETGRRVGITNLNKYSRALGLGELTGIELAESAGVLAGPDYRKSIKGAAWMPGNTIQAAIGQSDNMFTPIQLANYMGALANGGVRYKLHIIKEIKNCEDGSVVKKVEPQIAYELYIRPESYGAVMQGVRGVTSYGTACSVFRGFPVTLGGKTGTAEAYGEIDNAVFAGFGPFEDPEIAVSVVIEKGKHGTNAAYVAKDILAEYFKNRPKNKN